MDGLLLGRGTIRQSAYPWCGKKAPATEWSRFIYIMSVERCDNGGNVCIGHCWYGASEYVVVQNIKGPCTNEIANAAGFNTFPPVCFRKPSIRLRRIERSAIFFVFFLPEHRIEFFATFFFEPFLVHGAGFDSNGFHPLFYRVSIRICLIEKHIYDPTLAEFCLSGVVATAAFELH